MFWMKSVSALSVAALATSAHAQLFQPDSAIAGSEFSGAFQIGFAIDGSGMPAGFDPDSTHTTYSSNNHWTTQSGALQAGNAWAEFFFTDPASIRRFHMWNHLSNGIATDPGYAVTEFNIRFFDSSDALIHESLGMPALPNVSVAQTYQFDLMHDVARVRFEIIANNGSPQYTGLAEVAFDTVPAPGAATLLGLGLLVSTRRKR